CYPRGRDGSLRLDEGVVSPLLSWTASLRVGPHESWLSSHRPWLVRSGDPGRSGPGAEFRREDNQNRIAGPRNAGRVERGRITVPVWPSRENDPVDRVEAGDKVTARPRRFLVQSKVALGGPVRCVSRQAPKVR